MLGYIQGCLCVNIIHIIVIVSTTIQVFGYISWSRSFFEAATKRSSLYFKRVKLNTTTDRMKSDNHTDSASTSRYDIEQEDDSDYVKLCTDIIFRIFDFPVIWCFKLQSCITLFQIHTASSIFLFTIISLTAVTERINKSLTFHIIKALSSNVMSMRILQVLSDLLKLD